MYEKHIPWCQAHEVYSVMCVNCFYHFWLHMQAYLTSDPGWGMHSEGRVVRSLVLQVRNDRAWIRAAAEGMQ